MSKGKRHPARLRREESFLGIHFDFHAGDDCTRIGKTVTARMIADVIKAVRPDYVQCDCKGHRGLSSYPTRVGYAAPGFVGDPLAIWRDVTARYGVALYMHYSGVFDVEAVRRHPSWAAVGADGKRIEGKTSVFGPYVDRLMIPQLQELRDEYGVDGVWADGECWAAHIDFSRRAIEAFRAETGIRRVPRTPADPHWPAYLAFCREGFRRYLRHWVDAMHRHDSGFQAASNWAFSSFMFEPVSADVDYLSGDFSPTDSVNTARLEARCLAQQGIGWDLMAWSFVHKPNEGGASTKAPAQLKQEAAVVLSQGGGFQAYFRQKRDGSIHPWTMKLMAEAAAFCRARQRFCHRARPEPQVALLLSTAAYQRKSPDLFCPWHGELTALSGALNGLLDCQYSVEVCAEHHLAGRLDEYPLIVVPEWEYLDRAFVGDLVAYAEGGGSLLLVGPATARLFRKPLDVRFVGGVSEKPVWLEHAGWLGGLATRSRRVKLGPAARAFGRLFGEDDVVGPHSPAASIARLGRGRIAATYVNLGERYRNGRTATVRNFLGALVRELFPRPLVEVTGSHRVDVAVNRLDGKLSINLVNTAGPHGQPNVYTYDEVPPVGPLEIAIRTPRRPRRITVQPEGKALTFRHAAGKALCRLERLDLHSVIVVE